LKAVGHNGLLGAVARLQSCRKGGTCHPKGDHLVACLHIA
jgi:hypothetical protein